MRDVRVASFTLFTMAWVAPAAAQAPAAVEEPPAEPAPAEAERAPALDEPVPEPPREDPALTEAPRPPDPPDEPNVEDEAAAAPVEVEAAIGSGLVVSAGDVFSIQLRARIQFRIALTAPTDGAIAAGEEPGLLNEIMVRRMRVVIAGHAVVPELRYYVQLGVAPLDMEPDLLVPLRDAYLTWQFHRDVGVRFGQMKIPFGLQRVVSSSALQFADRSIATGELNLDRDIGLYLLSEDLFGLGGVIQYQLGVFGGHGRNRFGGLDKALFAGRVQVNPFGSFEHLQEADTMRSPEPRMSIGVSAAYNIDSNRSRSTHGRVLQLARFDYLHLGADVHLRWRGVSATAEVLMRWTDERLEMGEVDGEPVVEASRSAWGWYAQAGYLLPWFPLELAARWGEIRPFDRAAEARFFFQREIGGAVSYYVEEHSLKVQLDYFYLYGSRAEDERHQIRLQAQLYF